MGNQGSVGVEVAGVSGVERTNDFVSNWGDRLTERVSTSNSSISIFFIVWIARSLSSWLLFCSVEIAKTPRNNTKKEETTKKRKEKESRHLKNHFNTRFKYRPE